ncbi:pentapeptide repeat-containing protein [Nostoc sp. FACHB-110]|uniref:pentapeptide repeat-containing protein n=1 Tax=Nostoc sp. FACHB-110 TaxID=2692834 RepID=UPI001683CE31|nr:pentapeptide repeat-containing protein [Nostoc sp. FACHB-110]MBD2436183.1 pentapeptide repeat-containing protein [Nostoc sp. FACHB-110]
MFIHLINASHTVNKHLNQHNIFLNLLSGIGYSPEKKLNIEIQRCLNIAVEYLQHQILENHTLGIRCLEELIQEYPQSQQKVLEILTAFVRHNAPAKTPDEVKCMLSHKIHPDIQAALSIISKLDTDECLKDTQIDLSYTDLQGANLSAANLAASNLYRVNLSGANLAGANLSGAILSAAKLVGANLAGANLSGAILSAANLSEANLAKANLVKANLYLANLQQANLQEANLDQANLREAKFSG